MDVRCGGSSWLIMTVLSIFNLLASTFFAEVVCSLISQLAQRAHLCQIHGIVLNYYQKSSADKFSFDGILACSQPGL